MQKNKCLDLLAGISCLALVLFISPVQAQDNQSDITGTNIFTNPLPSLFTGNELNEETRGEAKKLAIELADIYQRCQSQPSGTNCVNLNELLTNSKTFLNNLNQQIKRVQTDQENRSW
ncbi:hypothetical protein [Nostoc sp. PCC 7107]|uniref:hypothetical protein n=1 Tax=Nostoc sp. PCC 7107 TaxID=317936 RepID=UPI00029F24E3|nr:hypothetical protein [Nostoc sp. PCC 7107]AFY43907.1 hypothetical protein Nos7107_3327 [Nostoc sp. PCC 7107]